MIQSLGNQNEQETQVAIMKAIHKSRIKPGQIFALEPSGCETRSIRDCGACILIFLWSLSRVHTCLVMVCLAQGILFTCLFILHGLAMHKSSHDWVLNVNLQSLLKKFLSEVEFLILAL